MFASGNASEVVSTGHVGLWKSLWKLRSPAKCGVSKRPPNLQAFCTVPSLTPLFTAIYASSAAANSLSGPRNAETGTRRHLHSFAARPYPTGYPCHYFSPPLHINHKVSSFHPLTSTRREVVGHPLVSALIYWNKAHCSSNSISPFFLTGVLTIYIVP